MTYPPARSGLSWRKSFSAIHFLESSGSGGFIPLRDGAAWIPLGQVTLGESGTMF